MKVWVAMDTEEMELLGIFSTKEKAQNAAAERAREQWDEDDEGSIEECMEDARKNDMPGVSYWEETVQ